MKKILILANNSVGLYNFRFELIEELIKQNYDVYFSLPEDKNDVKVKILIEAGAKHIQTYINRRGMNPIEDLKLISEYKKIIKNVDPDVILTYTIKPNIYGTYAAKKYRKPVILNVTGVGTSFNDSKLKFIVTNMYKYACNNAGHVFFQNESNYNLFITNKLAKKEISSIIPGSGVNIEKYRPIEKSKDEDKIKFLFISRIMQEKGIEIYIDAAKSINKKYDNTEFYILGPFEDLKYKRIIDEMIDNRIIYLGVSEDVINEIREIDCVIHPTYYPEGMSNVLLEAGAMGKPLIASDIPGCREIIENGVNGYTFEKKNKKELITRIDQFINLSSKDRVGFQNNSRKIVVQKFDRKIVVSNYLKYIKIFKK